jgi:TRAP-type C4-dicarboxylate transport system permease small subunit
VVGALMIIYAGYIYANAVWTGNATKATDPLKKAIMGIIIIISSYAIMRILTSMFLGF